MRPTVKASRLRGGPVLRAEQAEVRRREQAVEGVQARILALVQLRVAQRRCTALRVFRVSALKSSRLSSSASLSAAAQR